MSHMTGQNSGQKQSSIRRHSSTLDKQSRGGQSASKDNQVYSNYRLLAQTATENTDAFDSSTQQTKGNNSLAVIEGKSSGEANTFLSNKLEKKSLESNEKENYQVEYLQNSLNDNKLNRQKLININWGSDSYIEDSKIHSNRADLDHKLKDADDALIQDNEDDKDILTDLIDPDRDTLGSSSCELAALRSPSSESHHTGYESSPQPTLTGDFQADRGDTDTPTFTRDSPLQEAVEKPGRGTPHPRGRKSSVNDSAIAQIETIKPQSHTDRFVESKSETHATVDSSAGLSSSKNLSQDPVVQLRQSGSVKRTPSPKASVTPRGIVTTNLNHQDPQSPTEGQAASKPGSRFTTPYSSQRLKPQGQAAKRSTQSPLGVQQEETADFESDSLDFVKDSLEVNATQGLEKEKQDDVQVVDSLDNLNEQKTYNDIKINNRTNSAGDKQFSKTREVTNDTFDSQLSRNTYVLSVNEQEKQLLAPDVHLGNTGEIRSREVSSIKQNEAHVSNTSAAERQLEKPIFILKSDQRKSRSSSVHTTGRFSRQSQQQRADPQPEPRTASGKYLPMVGPSTASRVYVTSPTFSDEDEMQYRLVSSRLDGTEEEEDTYRELDMAAIQSQEGRSTGSKLPGGKHVTYGDSKDSVPKPQANNKGPVTVGYLSNPYGLKMASDYIDPNEPNDQGQFAGYNAAKNDDHSAASSATTDPGRTGSKDQGHIINHNPQLTGQTAGHLQPTEQRPSRVRGISLPTGPTYDPRDEEDLQRETSYQQGLLMRIEDAKKKVEEATIPMLPSNTGSQDFARDSLDFISVDETARAFVETFKADPEDYYDRHPPNLGFRNPPPLPQEFASSRPADRLSNVNFESDDYADYEDIRHHRVNPQVQPRFYRPQLDSGQGDGPINSSRYVEVGDDTERSQHSGSELTNGHPPIASANNFKAQQDFNRDSRLPVVKKTHSIDRTDFSDSAYSKSNEVKPQREPPMEAVQPKPPKYDYINNNKEDYGKPQPKSYTHIHEVTKEEKEKLNEIFIQPKVKPKKGILKKKKLDNKHGGSQDIDPGQFQEEEPEEERELSPAEQVWAQRSATLAKRFDGKGVPGKQKGVLQKYNSDSFLNQTRRNSQQKSLPNERKAFMTEMPTPPSQESSYKNQVSLPYSPRLADIQVLPVSSQITLDDGQRISVDVNLKLIPPQQLPPYQHHGHPMLHQQLPPYQHHGHPTDAGYDQQYSNDAGYGRPHPADAVYGRPHPADAGYGRPHPADVGYGRQHPANAGYGRQYPVVPQYVDEDFSGQDMLALEYNPQSPRGYKENFRYVSPRERYSADEALRHIDSSRTDINPYGKIPPIKRSLEAEHPSSAPEQAGGYTDMFRKQKEKSNEKPWYRVYGLKDYRKMQKEVRLGTLGPDLDSDALKERREKFQRQNEYAKAVMEKNKHDLVSRKPPAFPRPKEENDIMNRRKLANEYAKSVPKPIAKPQPTEYNNYELASERSPIAKHHRKPGDMVTPSPRHHQSREREMDVLDIEKLRQRYEEDKQNEALIRRNTSNSLPKGEKYY